MRAYCQQVPGPKMANMLEQGQTPLLNPDSLQKIGYKIAAYPLTLMLAGLRAMENALDNLKRGRNPEKLADFSRLRTIVGFPEYYEAEEKYRIEK